MNEYEYKTAVAAGAVCSVTGKPCRCRDSSGCRAHRTSVDSLPNELVQRLKVLHLHLEIPRQDTLDIELYDNRTRVWPLPEVRDIRRKLDEMMRSIEEILEK